MPHYFTIFFSPFIYFYREPEAGSCNMQDIESSTAAMNSLQGTVLASSDSDGLHIEYPQNYLLLLQYFCLFAVYVSVA